MKAAHHNQGPLFVLLKRNSGCQFCQRWSYLDLKTAWYAHTLGFMRFQRLLFVWDLFLYLPHGRCVIVLKILIGLAVGFARAPWGLLFRSQTFAAFQSRSWKVDSSHFSLPAVCLFVASILQNLVHLTGCALKQPTFCCYQNLPLFCSTDWSCDIYSDYFQSMSSGFVDQSSCLASFHSQYRHQTFLSHPVVLFQAQLLWPLSQKALCLIQLAFEGIVPSKCPSVVP